MKNNEAEIFVFIASVVIGILIALNINLDRQSNRIFLSAKQYQDAYNTRTKLISDINSLREQYEYYYDKLDKYQNSSKSSNHVLEEMNDEIYSDRLIMGASEVEGQGIEITLNDANVEFTGDYYLTREKLVHDFDILRVLNDIKNAGAEAIAINGQRIIDTSEVNCGGPFIYVNGVKVIAPFYISAIGDKETLKSYMLMNENYLKYLMLRQLQVSVVEVDNIKLPAFEGEYKQKFITDKKLK